MSDDNKLITERKKKLEELSSVTKLYPNTFRRNTNANELRQKYDGKSKEELESEDSIFSVSGRLLTVRKWVIQLLQTFMMIQGRFNCSYQKTEQEKICIVFSIKPI